MTLHGTFLELKGSMKASTSTGLKTNVNSPIQRNITQHFY